jgi:methionyl-tRNA synthetase
MLHAIGFPDEAMPQLLVHGWWNLGGAKMSKSAGNIVDPNALIDHYGAEALRYYLISDIVTGKDADFSEERLIERYNADLANNLGNLLNRTLNMAWKYRNGQLRGSGFLFPDTEKLRLRVQQLAEQYDQQAAIFQFQSTTDSVVSFAVSYNKAVEEYAPWRLAKDEKLAENEKARSDLNAVLYHLAESLRIIAILILPVLPRAAHGIFDQLNWKMELSGKEERFSLEDAEWGKLPDGHVVGKPVPLFPRIE